MTAKINRQAGQKEVKSNEKSTESSDISEHLEPDTSLAVLDGDQRQGIGRLAGASQRADTEGLRHRPAEYHAVTDRQVSLCQQPDAPAADILRD